MGNSLITGLSIGSNSIHAVVVKPVRQTIQLITCQEIPIESGLLSDNCTLNHQKIVNKLKELRKSLPIFSRKVSLSIAEDLIISQEIQIDNLLVGQEKHNAILQRFCQKLSLSVGQVYLDYQRITRPNTHTDINTSHYNVYAVKKSVVDDRRLSLQRAGFHPLLFGLSSDCTTQLWHLFSAHIRTRDYFWLDIGERALYLTMLMPSGEFYCNTLTQAYEQDEQGTKQDIDVLLEREVQVLKNIENGLSLRGLWVTGQRSRGNVVADWAKKMELDCYWVDISQYLTQGLAQLQSPTSNVPPNMQALGAAMHAVNWMKTAALDE
ncbi:pilus assembly protein PilM [Vibrio profundum]|uniref:pilus assembly protein PilM n=1 Tax=Vibrio profundum TaxID=2910247 RepID=UPI003D151462